MLVLSEPPCPPATRPPGLSIDGSDPSRWQEGYGDLSLAFSVVADTTSDTSELTSGIKNILHRIKQFFSYYMLGIIGGNSPYPEHTPARFNQL